MGRGRFADGRAERRLDHDIFVVGANFLENLGSPVWIEMVNEREVSRLIIRPSLEGTLADSLSVCVWIESSLLVFSGWMR